MPRKAKKGATILDIASKLGVSAMTVSRALTLQFTATDPTGLNPPNWGSTELGGIYRETITGLHRSAINVSGNFRLVRVLTAPALNQ